jgi:hypothetical protein
MQALELQTWPIPQARPQAPQCEGWERVSTQSAPQEVWLESGHRHAPFVQIVAAEHGLSQAPQCEELVRMSTQAPADAQ